MEMLTNLELNNLPTKLRMLWFINELVNYFTQLPNKKTAENLNISTQPFHYEQDATHDNFFKRSTAGVNLDFFF